MSNKTITFQGEVHEIKGNIVDFLVYMENKINGAKK